MTFLGEVVVVSSKGRMNVVGTKRMRVMCNE